MFVHAQAVMGIGTQKVKNALGSYTADSRTRLTRKLFDFVDI